jgi:adenylate cyclase
MLTFYVANKTETRRFEHAGGPIELGREPEGPAAQWVIQDDYVARRQLRVEERPGGRVVLENLSRKSVIALADGTSLGPGASREVDLPVRLTAGETLIEIAATEAMGRIGLQTIERPVGSSGAAAVACPIDLGGMPEPQTLARWFETIVAVQRAAASSGAFYQQTARAVVDLVGLDCGVVALRRGDAWQVVAQHTSEAGPATGCSLTILDNVRQERRTFYQGEGTALPESSSLAGMSAVVAAPILAEDESVLGVVYGSRGAACGPVEIRKLEAQLVQVLAAAVAAGLARVDGEAKAARMRVQFEQFFTPDLARELDRDPGLLDGREREVTVLFSDIRGFSRIAEQLNPRDTCQLVGDVMERLTARIRRHSGVVVDYIGDGLLAMWNAPADQPDHALLGCRAALAMLGELPGLSAEWEKRIGRPLGLGIGLNTGPALVGNMGSQSKFKYGPLGHAVNLASRVEGATKQLGVPILITGSTHAALGGGFATRRLCRVRVVGIAGEVDLHELHAEQATPEWLAHRDTYETGLVQYESGLWAEACRTLYPLLAGQQGNFDLPTLALVGRSIECLKAVPAAFDPVVELSSK